MVPHHGRLPGAHVGQVGGRRDADQGRRQAVLALERDGRRHLLRTSTTVADLTGGVCNGIAGLWLGGAVSTTTRTG